jgi:Trypsin
MNGIEKDIGSLPWVVAFCTEQFFVSGTGSIVSEKWVLTAGHSWEEAER